VSQRWWLTPVILAIQEAEIRRIMVLSQPRKIVHKILSQKHPSQKKKRVSGVTQGVDPEFKSQYHKKKKYPLQLEMLLLKRQNTTNSGEDIEKGELSCTVGGNVN
jgi:hypothetical protein